MVQKARPRYAMLSWLKVPIAAVGKQAIEENVGGVIDSIGEREDGEPDAVYVQTRKPHLSRAETRGFSPEEVERLFPTFQVWVHVENNQYRAHYKQFAMPPIPDGWFLDHVQNRKAIKAQRELLGMPEHHNPHPLLRLCPVTREVNSSGGHWAGGEGMEKDYLNDYIGTLSPEDRQRILKPEQPIIYADPMDLTKMLNKPPETQNLEGVRKEQGRFFTP